MPEGEDREEPQPHPTNPDKVGYWSSGGLFFETRDDRDIHEHTHGKDATEQ
jgi:hypothetical protein